MNTWTLDDGAGYARYTSSLADIIGGTHVIHEVASCDDGRWSWSVWAGAVANDIEHTLCDGVSRCLARGHAESLHDAQECAIAASRQGPSSALPLDVGFDPVALGLPVLLPRIGVSDLAWMVWRSPDGSRREMLASRASVSRAMSADGYAVR